MSGIHRLIFVFYRFHSNLSLSGVFIPFLRGGRGGVPHVFPWCLLWSFGEAGFDSHVNGRTYGVPWGQNSTFEFDVVVYNFYLDLQLNIQASYFSTLVVDLTLFHDSTLL